MNLLYVTHHTQTRARPRVIRLAERVASRGHRVTILCIADHALFGIREYVEGTIRFVEVPDLLPGKLRTGWCPWNALNRWLWLRKNFEFDLVHIFETRPATIHPLQLVLRKKKIPLVIDWIDWWGRGGIITTNRPRWYQILFGPFETFYEEHFRTMADATTVICTALGHRAEGLGVHPDSIFKVPIGADTENIPFVDPQTYRTAFGFSPADKIALFSAMDAVMDVELVFDAAKRVKESCPEFKLVMTGNGAEMLKNMAQQKGIGEFFVHLGRLPQEDFVKALTCADLFLLPFADKIYNRGRWPCKIGDYLAAGRPIISNPVGEVREIMRGGGADGGGVGVSEYGSVGVNDLNAEATLKTQILKPNTESSPKAPASEATDNLSEQIETKGNGSSLKPNAFTTDLGVLTDFTPEAFAEGILGVLNHPEKAKAMGATARRVAETDLAWDGFIDELERAYEVALKQVAAHSSRL